MAAPALKTVETKHETLPPTPSKSAGVVQLPPRKTPPKPGRALVAARRVAAAVMPPLVVVAGLLLLWQIAFSSPGASLPPPSTVWSEASDLILDPFFVHGLRISALAGAFLSHSSASPSASAWRPLSGS